MDIVNLLFVAILIALTAFFVASEFAIVKIRSSRLDQLIAEGKKGAVAAKKVTTHLDEYLSACQLGITVTALGLGWLGEPTVERLLRPVFDNFEINESVSHIITFGIAFASVTFLHVVIGELAPKTVAIQKAEAVTLLFAAPLIWFYRIMFPFIWVLNGSARVVTGLFGLKPASEHELAHTEEELRIILSESYESGEINQSELKYMNKIFEFDDRVAKEIMVPRTEIVAASVEKSFQDNLETMSMEKYTRYPVVNGDKDHVLGMINLKEIFTDIFSLSEEERKKSTIDKYIRPVIQVIESIPIHDLLIKMQKERVHMAILVDEYGGTAGLVTVEDIIEEIVGEIRDEFDQDEVPEVQKKGEGHYLLDGKVLIYEVNNLLGLDIDDTDVDTIGGWMLTENIDIQQGESIILDGYEFFAKEMEGHLIRVIEIFKLEKAVEELVAEEN
ncbi:MULTISPECIES: hemolysin family protein [Metabacillus]|uniref:Hemolysin family protein n=1 Tax=Metabacillus hrfriensis TaxID=3048891 RepID=A0ACD4R9M5_9BACI|nr:MULTISPECIES: hemolysin family protein [Metabacillus]UAL51671.1 hemolysin family protein [Metabacillus dongyingensis]USK27979.1 hemolysin family protein [Bacillus sp. CMF21]WHZ57187.1 hemolysin family protein [Metabacillus sp. CT-WN-B3]